MRDWWLTPKTPDGWSGLHALVFLTALSPWLYIIFNMKAPHG